jgi:hypothetical protein
MPPRRQAPPKTESKAGLVIALVFFILTTIGTGTAAYLGFDGQKELKVEADKAKGDAKKALADADAERARLLANQYVLGTQDGPKDDEYKGLAANPAFATELRKILEALSTAGADVKWDIQGGKPPETVVATVKKLRAEKDAADANARNLAIKADETKATADAHFASDEAAKKSAQAGQKKANDDTLVYQKSADDAKTHAQNLIADLKDKLTKKTGDFENVIAESANKQKKSKELLDDQNKILDKLERDREARRDKVLLKDISHGKVIRVDSNTGTAFINLGSEDSARPSLSFSILLPYDQSGLREDSTLPKKATIEVQQVLGPHLSRATIKYSDEVNPIKNPVETGDDLYKPGWNKGQPIRLAVIAHIDLNGQGGDEVRLLVQRLEKQGIIIQAYFDLSKLEWVGEFNHQIDYLVLGEFPHAGTIRMLGEERARLIERKIVEEVDKAKKMHVMVVRASQFLPSIGIDLPRRPLPPVFPSGSGPATAPTAPPKGEEKPKDKDEGK